MKITSQGKVWLQSEKGVKPDAQEPEFVKALGLALADGSLSSEKFTEFTTDEDAKGGSVLVKMLEKMDGRLAALEGGNGAGNGAPAGGKSAPGLSTKAPKMPTGVEGAEGGEGEEKMSLYEKAMIGGLGDSIDPQAPVVRVRGAHEQYDSTRKSMTFPSHVRGGDGGRHPFAGRPVFEGGDKGQRPIEELSQLDKAVAGSYIKWSLNIGLRGQPIPRQLRMTDHDHDLIQYAIREMEWGGVLHGEGSESPGAIGVGGASGGQKLNAHMQKALLDDSTSGGLESAPIVFDNMLITTPLLSGEFFPKVNVVNITRGRRIEGVTMSNVTLGSATEGSAVSLFNTANFIAAFDTTIFVCQGIIELGLDYLSDTPLDIAAEVQNSYQQQLLKWLDDQIIDGDGTTEPEGILQASGTTTVNSANGAGGPWTVGDEEALLFGVAKQYKSGDQGRIGYGANALTYRRVRGIQVGTTDQRRVFGMNHEEYQVFDRFFGINESFGNREQVFGHFGRYRMYRRLGMTIRSESGGSTLLRSNTMLISARSRWGGQLEDGAAFAVCTDGVS